MSTYAGITKKRSTTRRWSAQNVRDEPDTKPRSGLASVAARRTAPTASRPGPLGQPSQIKDEEGELSQIAIKEEPSESSSSLAQSNIPSAASAKKYIYHVAGTRQKMWKSPQDSKFGVYESLVDANNRVLELWNELFEKFGDQGYCARDGEEEDGRIWWEVSSFKTGRFWVRVEKIEVMKASGQRARAWGTNAPVNNLKRWEKHEGWSSLRVEMMEREKTGVLKESTHS